MANLALQPIWTPGVYQLETTDPIVGGPEGIDNQQAKDIGNRTEYLKQHLDQAEAEILDAREGEIDLKTRINKKNAEVQLTLAGFTFVTDSPIAASTENINVQVGGLSAVDGISLTAGTLVFLKNQTNRAENGFWRAQTGPWDRHPSYVSGTCFTKKYIDVKNGATNRGKIFYLNTEAYTVGTTNLDFQETAFTNVPAPKKIPLNDRVGRYYENVEGIEGYGKSLLDVFGVTTIAQAMAEIRRRCNNNNEINNSKIPDFRGIMIGDYIDLPSLSDGTDTWTWNADYKNLRLVVSGFNTYKNAGDTENVKNHILFTFRNCIMNRRMNATDTNTGGYDASEMKTYLDGVFRMGLQNAIGDYLYPVRRLNSTKGSWAWGTNTVFLPTEYEVFGAPVWSEIWQGGGFQEQYPIFRSTAYKCKRLNGSRNWWWLSAPSASSSANFCYVHNHILAGANYASAAGGVAPAFCVA